MDFEELIYKELQDIKGSILHLEGRVDRVEDREYRNGELIREDSRAIKAIESKFDRLEHLITERRKDNGLGNSQLMDYYRMYDMLMDHELRIAKLEILNDVK